MDSGLTKRAIKLPLQRTQRPHPIGRHQINTLGGRTQHLWVAHHHDVCDGRSSSDGTKKTQKILRHHLECASRLRNGLMAGSTSRDKTCSSESNETNIIATNLEKHDCGVSRNVVKTMVDVSNRDAGATEINQGSAHSEGE
jgi:hypothetical protein